MTGFSYDAGTGTLTFAHSPGARWFWSNGSAWGTFDQATASDGSRTVRLAVLGGAVNVSSVVVEGASFRPEQPGLLSQGTHPLRREVRD